MTQREFEIIDTINRMGWDNSLWSIDIIGQESDTRELYDTRESMPLPKDSMWIAVWIDRDSLDFQNPFNWVEDARLTIDNDTRLLLFKV